MAFGYTGGARGGGSSTSAAVTHGLAINSGDLVVIYLNYNSSAGSLTPSQSWDGSSVETPAGETAQQAMYWKIAGGAEPSAYDIALGSSSQWQLLIEVFTSSVDAVVDVAFATGLSGTTQNDLLINAQSGASLADNCLSVVGGGKDTRGSSETFTTADNSYTGVIGTTADQLAGMAHRIYTTSPSAPALITVTTADGDDGLTDYTYSTHISFVEGGGGGATSKLVVLSRRRGR